MSWQIAAGSGEKFLQASMLYSWAEEPATTAYKPQEIGPVQ